MFVFIHSTERGPKMVELRSRSALLRSLSTVLGVLLVAALVASAQQFDTGTIAGSVADSGRPDAWRCMSGNQIYDPCFAGFLAAKAVVACLSSPTAAVAVVLTPTGGVPLQEANKRDLLTSPPWSLDLVNGAHCALLTGATAALAGMRVNYGCTNRGSVIGEVDRSQPRWRVFYQAPNATTASLVDVATAWY